MRRFLGLGFVCACAPLLAQVAQPISDSPLAGLPFGLSVDATTYGATGALLDRARVYAKDVGWNDTAPVEPVPGPGRPDFRMAALFPGLVVLPDLDAISVGIDWILGDDTGVASVPPGHWGALTFSVSRATLGAAGSRLALERLAADGVAADILSYILPGSSVPAELTDKVHLAQDSREVSIFDGNVLHRGNIDAHDVFLSLYELDPALVAVLPPPRFLFSVTAASLAAVPSAWWGGTTPSGATVLAMTWTGSAWTVPSVFLRFDHFGLPAAAELDALAVDLPQGRVLFSTAGALPAEQIRFGRLAGSGGLINLANYRLPDQTPIGPRLGLVIGDDLDAICALDPGGNNQILRGLLVGTPLNRVFPSPAQVTGQVWRRYQQAANSVYFDAWLCGWPPAGPTPGVAVLFLQGVTPVTPLVTAAVLARTPPGRFGGDPQLCRLKLPPNTILLGATLDWIWAAADASLTSLDVAMPVRLRL